MSGFTVPNATDLAASVIASLDQSEPDALDFKIVGNRRSGVVSGGSATSVTSAPPAYVAVVLTSAEVIVGGVYGTITGSTVTIPAASTDPRFDIICANYDSGTGVFSYVVVAGTASATNAVFPAVTATQLPLYAVYVKSASDGGGATLLVDKRVFTLSNTVRTGAGDPSNSLGNVGDLYVNTTPSSTGRRSQLYIKAGASLWENLAEFANLTGEVTTVGAVATITDASVTSPKLGVTTLSSVATGTRTLALGDENTIVRMGGSTPIFQLNHSTVAVGTTVHIMQTTSTQVSITAATGTLNSAVGDTPKLRTQWSVATAVRYDATKWVVFGDIV